MDWLLRYWSRKVWILMYAMIGNVLLIVGIVTAALGTTISGFSPVVWLGLAFVCYWTSLFVIALRILIHLEAKK